MRAYRRGFACVLALLTLVLAVPFGGFTVAAQTAVASVVVEPMVRIENANGHWNREDSSSEYYYYDNILPQNNRIVITMEDGTVFYRPSFRWNGQYYSVEVAQQTYATRLQRGTNTIYASVMGFDFTYTIEIVESPVVTVDVPPVVMIEHANGRFTTSPMYDEDGRYVGESPDFYYYENNQPRNHRFTLTLKDGTQVTETAFTWEGTTYYLENTFQTYENRMQRGTNVVDATMLGYDFTYLVEIVETPVVQVESDRKCLVENVNGRYTTTAMYDADGRWVGESPSFFLYDNATVRNPRIHLNDGTVIEGSGFDWEGIAYYIYYTESQRYENRLLPGVNVRTAHVAGFEFTYEVEVTDTPVASVTTNRLYVVENADGYTMTDAIYDESGAYVGTTPEYFVYYQTVLSYGDMVVTLKDGSVCHGSEFQWYDNRYTTTYPRHQSYDNRLLPGVNVQEATIAGYPFTYEIEVVTAGSDDRFTYHVTETGVIITGCHNYSETLEIPAEIEGKPVIGVRYLMWSDMVRHISFPDSLRDLSISFGIFNNLESISFGRGIRNLTADQFDNCPSLVTVTVPADHTEYYVSDGALYDADGVRLFAPACAHQYVSPCDPSCELCGLWRTQTAEHIYTNDYDANCDLCNAWREPPLVCDHQWDTFCDQTCNLCGLWRDINAHVYDGLCDVECNECGGIRDIVPVHSYIYACDADCDVCGAVREVEHTYLHPCSPVCQICGIPNEKIQHFYLSDCHEVCYNCGEARVPLAEHSFDDAYDPWCNACNEWREVPEIPTVLPGDVDGNGEVNNRDLGWLQRYINGHSVDIHLEAANVDGNDLITNRDLGLLQRYLNGWDITLQ